MIPKMNDIKSAIRVVLGVVILDGFKNFEIVLPDVAHSILPIKISLITLSGIFKRDCPILWTMISPLTLF